MPEIRDTVNKKRRPYDAKGRLLDPKLKRLIDRMDKLGKQIAEHLKDMDVTPVEALAAVEQCVSGTRMQLQWLYIEQSFKAGDKS